MFFSEKEAELRLDSLQEISPDGRLTVVAVATAPFRAHTWEMFGDTSFLMIASVRVGNEEQLELQNGYVLSADYMNGASLYMPTLFPGTLVEVEVINRSSTAKWFKSRWKGTSPA